MCEEDKPDSEFGLWKIQYSARSKKAETCDTCLIQEEAQRKEADKENQKHSQESKNGDTAHQSLLNPKVKVLRPACDAAKEIDFDLIWKKGPSTCSFVYLFCQKEIAYNKRE